MNNKIRLLTILIASFFLVSLGMRNPYLSVGGAPKPHPRAVIENAAKNTLDMVQQLNIEAATPTESPYAAPNRLITLSAPAVTLTRPPLIRTARLAARAPPASPSLRS